MRPLYILTYLLSLHWDRLPHCPAHCKNCDSYLNATNSHRALFFFDTPNSLTRNPKCVIPQVLLSTSLGISSPVFPSLRVLGAFTNCSAKAQVTRGAVLRNIPICELLQAEEQTPEQRVSSGEHSCGYCLQRILAGHPQQNLF